MVLTCIAAREGKLLTFLRRELALSSTLVNRLKYRDAYRVNGEPARTNRLIFPGDHIAVTLEEPTPTYPAESGPLSILYEDEALIALDKPSGLMMHPSSCRNTGTLANYLTAYYQNTGQPCAVHPVSRLDRDTFGVVLLAKNAHIHALLCAAHKAGGIHKTYEAAVFGAPPTPSGLIDLPIARQDPRSLLRCIGKDGQPARTDYETLLQLPQTALLRLHPITGRTHQLRVHLAHLGCPILGDPQYGSEASQAYSLSKGLATQQLCATTLELIHPLCGTPMTILSSQTVLLPEYLAAPPIP